MKFFFDAATKRSVLIRSDGKKSNLNQVDVKIVHIIFSNGNSGFFSISNTDRSGVFGLHR